MIPSEVVAARIKKLRDEHGWTAQQLAERCADLGAPKLTAAAVANIETGRRKEGRRTRILTVEELLIFAMALDVPPLLLLMPEQDGVDVTSDLSVDPMQLATWASGLTPAAGLPSGFFSRQARQIREYYAAHEAIAAWKSADMAATQARGTEDEQAATARRDSSLTELARAVQPVLQSGIRPRALPIGLLSKMAARGLLDTGLRDIEEAVQEDHAALAQWNEEEGDG